MPTFYTSDSDDESSRVPTKLFGRQRHLHAVFGGGRVADVILWRNKNLSAAILIGFSLMWFLFEVVEYPFLTLMCHISITAMLLLFIWSNGAALFDRSPPKIPEMILSESAFRELSLAVRAELNRLLSILNDIASGKDLFLFILSIIVLWILSVVGSYFSSLSILYMCYLSLQILPALYERYEKEVDHLASQGSRDMRKLFKRFDSQVLNKIPRGPVKEKKYK
ncbi:reticulon-like protein B9 [Aristolochia californica]|uniref:reticulon-like protein B9 n=1 Tax=Aristolochia californica TaxID=171875 RepID=UPI0035E075C1